VRASQLVFSSTLGENVTVEAGEVVFCCGRYMYKVVVSATYRCVLVQLLIQKYVIALQNPLSILIRQ
jgi:hypothetical protein